MECDALSVTVTMNVEAPVCSGEPEIVSPRSPDAMLNVNGGFVPFASSVVEYGAPTEPSGSDVLFNPSSAADPSYNSAVFPVDPARPLPAVMSSLPSVSVVVVCGSRAMIVVPPPEKRCVAGSKISISARTG